MNPESSPRYMATMTTTRDTRISQLEAEIAELDSLSGMFSSSGWKLLESQLQDKADQSRRALTLPSGVSTLDELYAQRERLAVFNWLLFEPKEVTDRLERVMSELNEMRDNR